MPPPPATILCSGVEIGDHVWAHAARPPEKSCNGHGHIRYPRLYVSRASARDMICTERLIPRVTRWSDKKETHTSVDEGWTGPEIGCDGGLGD